MTRSIRLRPWQKAALDRFDTSPGPDFLAVATPGAGKTTFALTAAVRQMTMPETPEMAEQARPSRPPRRLIVVAPTAHLKAQWAAAATAFGLHLDPTWAATDGALPPDMHGIVTTYQQVAGSAKVLRHLAGTAMVVFDEIHHAGDDRAWGQAIRHAFEPAPKRLALSGTPFRSDTRAIPFLNYVLDEVRPDFEYGYGAALADGRVVRPIFFPRTNGTMEWSAPDGSVHSADLTDPLEREWANQRLRTALSLEGDWLPTVLTAAHQRLTDIRRTHPEAGGLVIATDQDHARGIADALAWRFGVRPTIATSDDTRASAQIDRFSSSNDPWLVAVRMVSEGVDIPRLRVGVYATTTTTELFFRQAVGRFVRWTRGVPAQRSYLFIPDDARLRARAFQIAEIRRHHLRKDDGRAPKAQDPAALDGQSVGPEAGDDQLSLFTVISATATGTDTHGTGRHDDEEGPDDDTEDPTLVLELAALPPLSGAPAGSEPTLTRREHKRRLRDANAELARDLVRRSGWPHPRVNAELNRLAGIRKVTEATVDQLEKRLRHAERWYSRLRA
ncbi:MAG: DEAD/DEAH box helicase family protein [Actinomycetota bacterium]|nr:DEAD/DEAH box helicase family protein [Actinomycetota bacterium]